MRQRFCHLLVAILTVVASAPSWAIRLGAAHAGKSGNGGVAIEIPVELGEAESLARVAVASENVYRTLGILFPPGLRGASVVVAERGAGSAIRVSGTAPVAANFTLLLELDTNNGRVVRQMPVNVVSAEETGAPAKGEGVRDEAANKKVKRAEKVAEPLAKVAKAPKAPVPDLVPVPHLTSEDFNAQMETLNDSVGRVAVAVGHLADQMRKDSEVTAGALAAIQAATAPKVEPPKDIWGEYAPAGLAGLFGFLVGGLWFVGSRPRISAGSPVKVLSADGAPIEGELVRLAAPSDGKALPYRIADVLTGAPRRLEVRVSSPMSATAARRPLDSRVTRIGPAEVARMTRDGSPDVVLVTH